MVAPIDAVTTLTAGGQTLKLQLNWRTIALAEDQRADAVTSFGGGKPNLSGLAAILWAFAQPAQPDFTMDDAFALVMRHGKDVGEAVSACFAAASKEAEPEGDGSPTKSAGAR